MCSVGLRSGWLGFGHTENPYSLGWQPSARLAHKGQTIPLSATTRNETTPKKRSVHSGLEAGKLKGIPRVVVALKARTAMMSLLMLGTVLMACSTVVMMLLLPFLLLAPLLLPLGWCLSQAYQLVVFCLVLLPVGIRWWNQWCPSKADLWLSTMVFLRFWTVDGASRMVEEHPDRLANRDFFAQMMTWHSRMRRVHVHILNTAIRLMKSGTQPSTLLRSIIKNTFPYYAMTESTNFASMEETAALLKECNLFHHRDVLVAWFEAGLPLLESIPQAAVQIDEEIYLLIAERCRDDFSKVSVFLHSCGSKIRGKKEFALEVLKIDPSLYPCFMEVRYQELKQKEMRTLDAIKHVMKPHHLDDLAVSEIFQFSGVDTNQEWNRIMEETIDWYEKRTAESFGMQWGSLLTVTVALSAVLLTVTVALSAVLVTS